MINYRLVLHTSIFICTFKECFKVKHSLNRILVIKVFYKIKNAFEITRNLKTYLLIIFEITSPKF